MTDDSKDYQEALLDPASVFSAPEEVLERDDLTRSQKIQILRRWEYDAREIEVAEEEGMGDDDADTLQRIVLALETLDADSGSAEGPPTKQGGE
jgi:hypothetical protein